MHTLFGSSSCSPAQLGLFDVRSLSLVIVSLHCGDVCALDDLDNLALSIFTLNRDILQLNSTPL